ncbi:hypothetical protein DFH29DRAFT_634618 [Suillus ampliporus]|nr:hypothetical protein DFH29DRAFT_634618 [Suillus ampliporus]
MEDKLPVINLFWTRRQSFLLVLPWDRSLLELHDSVNLPNLSDTESVEDSSSHDSLLHDSPVESLAENGPDDFELYSRALRLIVRLEQPFSAFLLAWQRGGEYKRIASDQNIIAQVKDMAHIHDAKNFIRMLDIL